jgi:adenine-specific DNA methylase
MLLALMLPDPEDVLCPEAFKAKAREALSAVQGRIGSTDQELREGLLKFIGDFSNWSLSSQSTFVHAARELVSATGEESFLVADPFSGGGSIPLEALRLNCDVWASDVNPVAGLVLKAKLIDLQDPTAVEELRGRGAGL